MNLDLKRLRENIERSSTEDLLDRITVFRHGMEPEAVLLVEEELARRGVSAAERADHAESRESALMEEGRIVRCHACHRPATGRRSVWVRLFGVVPLFPISRACCATHS